MNIRSTFHCPALLAPGLFAAAALTAAPDAPPAPDPLAAALAHGQVSLNARARYEGVEQRGLKAADAYTIRTQLGFTTAPVDGFTAKIEAENITAIEPDRYSQAGLNAGGAGRAVVADPVGTEINQVWLACTTGKDVVTLGRQRLVLDNARFVGDVGWRQNTQTFDAVTFVDRTLDPVTLTYAYLYQIDRVFGDRHTQGRWRSDSHVVNARYAGLPIGTLTGYAYLLAFRNAAPSNSATFGASLTGARPVARGVSVSYRAEYARQTDYRNRAASYSADYWAGELGLVLKPATLAGGCEVLGTDGGRQGFATPLATLHAFNGWADVFLTTPAGGLRDRYGKIAASLPAGIALLGFYHDFETDTGTALGTEWDLQLARKFGRHFTGLVKSATFDRDNLAVPQVKKAWVQLEFNY